MNGRRRGLVLARRRTGKTRSRVSWGLAAVVLLVLGIWLIKAERTLARMMLEIAAIKASNEAVKRATDSIGRAVSEVDYDDIIRIERDSSGRITLMQSNVSRIGQIQADAVSALSLSFGQDDWFTIRVPVGQVLLGSPLFAGWGPSVGLYVYPAGATSVQLHDRFEAAGVNAVRHVIYLECRVTLKIVVPWSHASIQVPVTCPVVDAILPGEVPSTYLQTGFSRKPYLPGMIE